MSPARELASAFLGALDASLGTDWNDRERLAKQYLAIESRGTGNEIYLGGDLVRPYLSWLLGDHLLVVSQAGNSASQAPRLLAELDRGAFGVATRSTHLTHRGPLEIREIAISDGLRSRLSVPRVTLATLTNASRYRAFRFPLNIARLAQWLRFSHSARVTSLDASLDAAGDIEVLGGAIVASDPHLLGVSLNFGELGRLADLLATVSRAHISPLVCVGNVLAAWSPDEVQRVCADFETVFSSTYGEGLLEAVCDSWNNERRSFDLGSGVQDPRSPPRILLLPDEGLIARTVGAGGQLSIETSFGCQYGRCSFCPRDHRGEGWSRPSEQEIGIVVARMGQVAQATPSPTSHVLSLVDEDAFGQDGVDEAVTNPSLLAILDAADAQGLRCEIYTRLEQIFDRGKSLSWNARRLEALSERRESLRRVFVGVESGSPRQLLRYGKGQTVQQTVDALRAGSLLGLPFEFGFITFDPLLSQDELVENIAFLRREDVLLDFASQLGTAEILALALDAQDIGDMPGRPLLEGVAYMATELELLVSSRYVGRLRRKHPELLKGFDHEFSTYDFHYRDKAIEEIASWCRVWTEGTFESIYRLRLEIRSRREAPERMVRLLRRYRTATYHLLVALGIAHLSRKEKQLLQFAEGLTGGENIAVLAESVSLRGLSRLWEWVLAEPGVGSSRDLAAQFDVAVRYRRRRS